METRNTIALIVVLGALLIGATYLFTSPTSPLSPEPNPDENGPVACTLEAKMCPDGSYVGRTGPRCEFEKCPGEDVSGDATYNWQTFSDTARGISFRYPASLPTTYTHTVDWPPQVQLTNGPFTCTEAGTATGRAGQTMRKTIAGQEYCITTVSEGAAGSTYIQYAYAFPLNNRVPIFTFSVRQVQCANYDEPERGACESERRTFSVDILAHSIAQTLQLTQAAQ